MTLAVVALAGFVAGVLAGVLLRRRRVHLSLDVNGDDH